MKKIILLLLLMSFTWSYSQTYVTDLATLRSQAVPGYYQVSNEVTITSADFIGGHKVATVQDSTGAITIYDQSDVVTINPNLYDGIIGMRGNLTISSGILVFVPDQNPTLTGNNSPIIPEDLTLAVFNADYADYEAELIRIVDATIDPAGDTTFAASTDYNISDSSGTGVLKSGFSFLIGDPIPTEESHITGIAGHQSGVAKIAPRNRTDFDSVPTLTVPSDISVNVDAGVCGATVSYTVTATDYDDGVLTPTLTTGIASGQIFPVGTTTVTYEVTDSDNNTVSDSFTVTVTDNEDPVANCVADFNLSLDATGNATLAAGDIDNNSTDNCSFVPSIDITAFDCSMVGPNTITLTVTDPAGNTDTCTTVVTVVDDMDPVAIAQAFTANLDPLLGTVTVLPADIDNGSNDNCGIVTMTVTPNTFDCSNLGSNAVVLEVTDAAGNSHTAPALVTVADVTAPVADTTPLADVIAQCEVTSLVPPTATDVCSAVTVTNDATLPINAQGTTVVTWTYTDASGNFSTQTQNVVITDTTPPVADVDPLADIMEPCEILDNAALLAYSSPTATDNCGGAVTVTNDGVFPIEASVTITWTYTDVNGNASTQTQEVVINDTSDPIISCPADVMANTDLGTCGATVSYAIPSAIDPDGSPVTVTQTDTTGFVSGDVFPVGTTTIEFTATDECGNETVCDFNITITDTEAPVAVCQDVTVELDAAGNASITPADIDNGSSDNCAFTLSLDNMAFSCANLGANTVTLTVTDASGNTDTCTATVTVEDNQAPVVMCKGGGGNLSITENFDGCALPAGWSLQADMAGYDVEGSCDGSGTDGLFSFSCTDGDYVGFPGGDNSDFSGCKAVINDDNAGPAYVGSATIVSPIYDLSAGAGINLTFDYAFNNIGSATFVVEAFNGSTWNELLNVGADTVASADLDISGYSNADFQVRFIHNDGGFWAWGVAFDNFVLSYETAATPPLEVDLMADGTISIDPADLLVSVTDNCSYTVQGVEAAPCEVTNPSNAFENGSGISNAYTSANDLVAEAGVDFVLNQVTVNLFHGTGTTIPSIDVYYYEDNAGMPGTQIGSEMGIVPASQTVIGSNYGFSLSQVVLDVADFTFASVAGAPTTYWVGLQGLDSGGGIMFWETTSASPAGNETMYFDAATSVWAPQPGMDGVYAFGYDGDCNVNIATIDLDCSNIGENSIDVSVTDAAGNEATCTATVIVSDVTAPLLVCGPDPIFYGNAFDSDSPALAIPANTTASTTITLTDDFTLDDLNLYVNISYPSLNELNIDLTSPAGTTLNLFFPIGGCAGVPDLDFYFDDEGVDSGILCSDLQTGGHFDIAAVLGLAPLSTFDGESLMGDWTLTVTAGPSGVATVNSWGLEHEYQYPNPSTDLNIELDATGNYTIGPDDILNTQEEACGIDVILTDVTDVDCSDIGTPIMVTVFANDASGNFASCQYEVNVVDTMAPVLTCPGNLVEGTQTGTYTIPDYIANGDTFATDNCTDAANITLTQTPAPGTVYGITVGTANPPIDVIFTATDAYGNESVCQFELEIQDATGVNENTILDGALEMFPNPATQSVTLRNNSQFTIDTAMVYDINGKLVKQVDLQTSMSFDVSHLDAGVYMVKIIGDDATAVKRLIVE